MPIIGQISVGDGATFTPAVDNDGVISWSNNKNLPNPASVDIPQTVMDRYQIAPIASPAFTGNPTAPTQAKTDNSTKLATTAYVKAVVADYLELTGGSITGDVDITGDLSVSGAITGNVTGDLTGNVTGNVTGTASGNLALSGGTITGNLNVTGTLKKSGNNVVTSNFSIFTVSKTNNMSSIAVGQAIRMGNLAIVSFDGKMSTSSKAAWTDTDIMTFSVTTSGTTYGVGLTNNGTSVLLQVANNKVTYRTLNHAVNDDTIRGLLVFPISGF